MRPAGPDLVLLVAGVLLFAGATYGMMTFDEETPGGGVLKVTWKTADTTKSDLSPATVPEGGRAQTNYALSDHNVTAVAFKAVCSDASPRGVLDPATVTLEVTAPDGRKETASARCGEKEIVVRFDFPTLPANTTLAGSGEENARALAKYDTTNATGSYAVNVRNARAQTGAIPGLPGGVASAQARLSLVVTTYSPVIEPVSR
jgi:hypothetical protein